MYMQLLDKPGWVLPFTLKGKKSAEAKNILTNAKRILLKNDRMILSS